jgi:hypothetical protein
VPSDRLGALLVQMRSVAGERAWLDAGCRVVVTSRPFGYQPPAAHFVALDLLPLGVEGRRDLLASWLSSQAAGAVQIARIAAAIESQPSLRALAGNPFLLTLMALLALDQIRAGEPIQLPARRAQLLANAIDYLLRGRPRASPAAPPLRDRQKVRHVLEDLALGLLRTGGGPYDLDPVLDLVRASEGFGRLAKARPEWSDPEVLLESVAQVTGLLIAVDEHRTRWRFEHRALQERLAATALHRAGATEWSVLASQLGRDSDRLGQWAETFALLAGERGDEERLLRDLSAVNPDLAIRALARRGGPWVCSGRSGARPATAPICTSSARCSRELRSRRRSPQPRRPRGRRSRVCSIIWRILRTWTQSWSSCPMAAGCHTGA